MNFVEEINIGLKLDSKIVENINSKISSIDKKFNVKNVIMGNDINIQTFNTDLPFKSFMKIIPTPAPLPAYVSLSKVNIDNVNNFVENINKEKDFYKDIINKNIKYDTLKYPLLTLTGKFDEKDDFIDKDDRYWTPHLSPNIYNGKPFVGIYNPKSPSKTKEVRIISISGVPVEKKHLDDSLAFWMKKYPEGTVLDFYNSKLYKRMRELSRRNADFLAYHFGKGLKLPLMVGQDKDSYVEDKSIFGLPKTIVPLSYQTMNTLELLKDNKMAYMQNCSMANNAYPDKVIISDPFREIIGFNVPCTTSYIPISNNWNKIVSATSLGWIVNESSISKETKYCGESLDLSNIESKLNLVHEQPFYYEPIIVKI